MPFQQLQLTVLKSDCEQITEQLEFQGALAITYLDAEDKPIYEPPITNTKPLWEKIIVQALFPEECNIENIIHNLHVGIGNREYKINKIKDQEWERVCMDQFKPMQFGQKLWICPSWHETDATCYITDISQAVIVLLDPGLAFGTGTHATTRLCLTWLSNNSHNIKNKNLIIDYGCGSGILGIAALKLGAQKVIGIDIDPQALLASCENAHKNQVDLSVCQPEELEKLLDKKSKADMIIANILAGPLMLLADVFANLLMADGKLVISGILIEQCDALKRRYQEKFIFNQQLLDEEWVMVEFTKR